MDKAHFEIKFCGPAMKNHEMDVRELAPALLAFNDIFQETNLVLNEGAGEVSIHVTGFKSGSFGVELNVFHTLAEQFNDFFNSSQICATAQFLTLLGVSFQGTKGLVHFIKWLRNRIIQSIDTKDKITKVTLEDGETEEFDSRVIKLYQHIPLLQELEKAVKDPLEIDGISSISFIKDDQEPVTIQKSEKGYFRAPEFEDQQVSDNTYDSYVQLVNVSFREENKWRLSDGSSTFYASVLDDKFLKRVQHNEVSFSKDDLLLVKLRKIQYETSAGLKAEYEVLKILEYRPAGKQLTLPVSGGE